MSMLQRLNRSIKKPWWGLVQTEILISDIKGAAFP